MFNSEASLFSEGTLLLTRAEGRPNFSHLGAGEKLNQSLTNKHFFFSFWSVGQNSSSHLWGKEWKFRGSASDLVIDIHKDSCESYLVMWGGGIPCSVSFSRAQSVGNLLIFAAFQEHGLQVIVNTVIKGFEGQPKNLHLLLLWLSSFLYIDLNSWPLFFSFSLKNFL